MPLQAQKSEFQVQILPPQFRTNNKHNIYNS